MRALGRLAIGAVLAFAAVWLSAFAYSMLIRSVPFGWWQAHIGILYTAEILTFIPFVVALALLSLRLFRRHAVTSTFACTLVGVTAALFPTALNSYRQDVLWLTLRANAEFILMFVLGAPLIVLALQRWRADLGRAPLPGARVPER
jgi:uncharacterized membrane protein